MRDSLRAKQKPPAARWFPCKAALLVQSVTEPLFPQPGGFEGVGVTEPGPPFDALSVTPFEEDRNVLIELDATGKETKLRREHARGSGAAGSHVSTVGVRIEQLDIGADPASWADDAVQPGRRITTVRRSAGIGLSVALISKAGS